MNGRSIAEAVVVFSIFQIILLMPEGMRNLVRWENRTLSGSYITGVLMIALAIFMIILRQYDFSEMGLSSEGWRKSVNYGLRGWIFFIIPQCLITFFFSWGVNYKESIELASILGGVIIISALIMSGRNEVKPANFRRLFIMGVLIISLFVYKLLYDSFTISLMKGFLWNILVGGFTEEFFYRGYIQSTINSEFGKGWKLGNVRFGPGLIVSALLYGFSRGLRTIKPWKGIYPISWSWTLFAFTVGLYYGLIRESSGDIISSGIANSLIDAVGEVLVG